MISILDTDNVALVQGDCLDVLRQLEADSVDAVVTDPPYGLSFMGKAWDYDVPKAEVWREVLRVLKPGGHLLSFFGSRTFHRGVVQIEDAGFEIRDSLMWLYGTGFPKSLNVSKAIDEAGGTPTEAQARNLKARRELAGMTREQVAERVGCTPSSIRDWEEGRARARGRPIEWIVPSAEYRAKLDALLGYSADARQIEGGSDDRRGDGTVVGLGHSGILRSGGHTPEAAQWEGWGTALKPAHEPICLARKPLIGTVAANVLKHGTGGLNIDGCRIGSGEARTLNSYASKGAQGSISRGAEGGHAGDEYTTRTVTEGRWPANVCLDEEAAALLDAQSSASRFFYVAKASRAERDLGCEALPAKSGGEATDREDGSKGTENPRAGAGRTGGAKNYHPTVKPIALMRWLVRLVTPPGGTVLDPFTGSGTTGIAALEEGFNFLGIERDPDYCEIAKARISASSRFLTESAEDDA